MNSQILIMASGTSMKSPNKIFIKKIVTSMNYQIGPATLTDPKNMLQRTTQAHSLQKKILKD